MSAEAEDATTATDADARKNNADVNDDMNEADVFECVADKQPDSPCVSFDGELFTYREFDDYANRFAHAFLELGVRRDDRVALVMRNVPEHLGSIVGLMKISAAAVNTNFMYAAAEIANILADSRAVGVVVESEFADTLAEAIGSVTELRFVVSVGEPGDALKEAAERSGIALVDSAEALAAASRQRPENTRSGDDKWILYTGGTTGHPKGVVWRAADYYYACLSGGNPYGEPRNSPQEVADNTFEGFRAFVAAPLMHGAGMFTFFTFLNLGAYVALQRTFDPERILRATAEEKAAVLVIVGDGMGVPIADELREMTAAGDAPDLSGLFMISSGGGIWSAANQTAFSELLPNVGFRDNVGASESGNDGEMKFDEAGRLKLEAGRGILVVDLDLERMEPGTGEIGYIVRTGHLPLEYLGDPDKSAQTFVEIGGRRASLLGDMGLLEADGSITFLGRGSGCINTGGEKVFPEEVESTLKLHPAVFDALVVGAPDPRFGESVAAVVSVREGFEDPGAEELREHVRGHLAGYKAPRQVVVVDQVKRSPAGKADYRWAKSQVEA
ncbi:AMP-binding protein [Dietzia timorensis]|uniref:Long-chain-fatty-acid--CoA ligase FadD19 n=1 Tax=Dietzia timorensis TaxID=499555 RepID=A0A173LGM7_9ACTN|nr:AMP-binding protein [Dietzia timorensis]ANI91476.1 Long-chain-fatty-acid--CoA ligase FadD19 [Dietzia timorensis]